MYVGSTGTKWRDILPGCGLWGFSRVSIQLEASYNAFHHVKGMGGTGPSLQDKPKKG